MLSNLLLLVLENPTVEFVLKRLDTIDKRRLENWYERSTHIAEKFPTVLETFLWCCTDGEYAADTQNPEIFIGTFESKAKELGLSMEILSNLFFTHATLFDDHKSGIAPLKDSNVPLFIVFEGLDGSGKSTQISMLRDKLKLMGRKVYVTAEPTNSATGGLIRDTLSNNYKREPSELAGLFLTDRISHNVNPIWGIKKILKDGSDIICDRYYYSSFAYQGLGSDLQWIIDMNLNCPQIIKPDLCIYLDVDPHKCKKRVDSERTHLEIFENDEKVMEQTRMQFFEVFKKLNTTENIRVIDANRPINVVADEILTIVMSLIKRSD
ncbi:MAG: dTMP kinase [Oscillospiraceae bacterium]|nr:dTMP kinase [Oscillospiraceae bacterium]